MLGSTRNDYVMMTAPLSWLFILLLFQLHARPSSTARDGFLQRRITATNPNLPADDF